MIQWVFEAAKRADIADAIVVATPDSEIVDACRAFGADAVLTRDDHPSGTDRLAEVALKLHVDFFVNVQGDEPLIDPATIRACAKPLVEDASIKMASVYSPGTDDECENPAVVKVVTDLNSNALYFSRHAIPFLRNPRPAPLKKHIGIYAYRREILLQFAQWKPTPLEVAESLEQLRFLENGVAIRMVQGQGSVVAVDTPEQAEEVRRLMESNPSPNS